MAWVIKDLSTNEYYRQRLGAGWYCTDINNARLYTGSMQAQRVIDKADHHVTFPYNRNLKVVEVKIIEITN